MSLFVSYTDYYNTANLDQRKDDLIYHMIEFFDPQQSDKYFFMDPYLNVVSSIQDPFRESTVEDKIWSFLITELSGANVQFSIITREDIEGLIQSKDEPPYTIPIDNPKIPVSIQVCQYKDTKYCGLALHDRYILQEKVGKYKGMHIGPSLEDIKDKDISITTYTEESAKMAWKSFTDLPIRAL